ncbi:BglII/BstYI family type II restriction endonuclease [Crassaminicella profunda]|uniref:BglII/BstYI family type II restriction endonuclease n=1 Tax=Crassaminicella profunda TaxID=1286698 RepID=UPI001CA694E5|nr:BglII/BstYI family type II restriction endonuclease [Crassaminicella profunda]QZY55962.1 hypothetical protein K7H06_02785 [Crassaminicella profunda]
MEFITHSFRYGLEIFQTQPDFNRLWLEVIQELNRITDYDIITYFNSQTRRAKSISDAINHLIDERLRARGWNSQSNIFNESEYRSTGRNSSWRLDFAKDDISIEVAFNHGEAVAWNLIKPVLASELNHVEKAIQTRAGILICATDEMKRAGGFDGSVGTYEKYLQYLRPLNNLLTVPMVVVGLLAPRTFRIEHYKDGRNTYGRVVYLE